MYPQKYPHDAAAGTKYPLFYPRAAGILAQCGRAAKRKKPGNLNGLPGFPLVDDTGLEPVTLRTSSMVCVADMHWYICITTDSEKNYPLDYPHTAGRCSKKGAVARPLQMCCLPFREV